MIRIFVISVMILIMSIVIPINVRAQNITATGEKIIAHTDKKSYVVGEDVVLSGKVSPVVKGERLRIDVYDPKGAVFADNIGVAYFNNTDGTFSTRSTAGMFVYSYLKLDSNSVKDYGTYKALITYNGQNVSIPFSVTATAQ